MRRTPVVCPKCNAAFVEIVVKTRSSGNTAAARGRPRTAAAQQPASPWARRSGAHSPFAEANARKEEDGEGAEEAKVTDDGDADDAAERSEAPETEIEEERSL